MAGFDPQRSAVYRLARRHTRAVRTLLEGVDYRGYSDEVNQLRRSAGSMVANLREGFGEWRPAKRANYFMIAKASTAESGGHVDTLVDFGIVADSATAQVRDLQDQITALLITMIRNIDRAALTRDQDARQDDRASPR